ncbi:MAG: hypothetical protein A4E57_02785 [Syntrophorhabdaceae bacterium PtaU1.Bin034]|nr:MAG: hypothetical protein A4E57_02785 [Syntrophorhabdaceae bacterium PtaU1.Bin034]
MLRVEPTTIAHRAHGGAAEGLKTTFQNRSAFLLKADPLRIDQAK